MQIMVFGRVTEEKGIKRQSCSTRIAAVALCSVFLASSILGGCAARQQTLNTDEYVEIDNPFIGDSSGDNPKIWVPKKSLEKGVPRGSELLKKGYETVAGKPVQEPLVVDAAAPPTTGNIRQRLLIVETGEQLIAAPLGKLLGRGCNARALSKTTSESTSTEQEQLAYSAKIASQPSGGPVLFLSKPEGTKPGAHLKADLYDIRGPILIRTFTLTIPQPGKDQSQNDAVVSALKGLSDAVLGSLEWFSWYGRVAVVSGGRIYIDSGAETGLKIGQRLAVYRGGEAIKGIGFAPGERITTFTLSGLVGPDGSFGTSEDAAKVQLGDYVELEK
jgi:hypothetical protein